MTDNLIEWTGTMYFAEGSFWDKIRKLIYTFLAEIFFFIKIMSVKCTLLAFIFRKFCRINWFAGLFTHFTCLEPIHRIQLKLNFTIISSNFSTKILAFEWNTFFTHPNTLKIIEAKVKINLFFANYREMPLLFLATSSFLWFGCIPSTLSINFPI